MKPHQRDPLDDDLVREAFGALPQAAPDPSFRVRLVDEIERREASGWSSLWRAWKASWPNAAAGFALGLACFAAVVMSSPQPAQRVSVVSAPAVSAPVQAADMVLAEFDPYQSLFMAFPLDR
jgi:hypothetical protein